MDKKQHKVQKKNTKGIRNDPFRNGKKIETERSIPDYTSESDPDGSVKNSKKPLFINALCMNALTLGLFRKSISGVFLRNK